MEAGCCERFHGMPMKPRLSSQSMVARSPCSACLMIRSKALLSRAAHPFSTAPSTSSAVLPSDEQNPPPPGRCGLALATADLLSETPC